MGRKLVTCFQGAGVDERTPPVRFSFFSSSSVLESWRAHIGLQFYECHVSESGDLCKEEVI